MTGIVDNPDTCERMYLQLAAARKICDAIEAAFKEQVRAGLQPEWEFGPETTRTSVNTAAVKALVAAEPKHTGLMQTTTVAGRLRKKGDEK
jgi:hypothetical protein